MHTKTWRAEVWATILLGLPLIASQIAQMAINMTNTLVVGRLGPDELAAAVLGWQLFFVVWIFGNGFGFAVMPLVANAASSKQKGGVARYAHMGLWVSLAYSLIVAYPLSNSHAIFLALGQDPHIAALASDYMSILHWSMFPQLAMIVLRSLLGGVQKPNIVMVALVGGVLINLALSLVLVFGTPWSPALGIKGAGWATLIATLCIALFLFWFAARYPGLRRYKVGHAIFKIDPHALLEIFRLGWPIGTTIVAEVGMFTVTSIMMGWLGPLELAAHGIAVQLSGLAFMVPLGLSAAATIRVGWAHGRQDGRGVGMAAGAAIFIGLSFACLSCAAFLLFPQALAGMYLNLEDASALKVIPYAVTFLAVAAAFQLVDALQTLSNGALRGLKDTRVPMIFALISYWVLGIPGGYLFAFVMGFGGIGIWFGMALGLSAAATSLTVRLIWQVKSLKKASLGPALIAN